MRRGAALAALCGAALALPALAAAPKFHRIEATTFRSVLPPGPGQDRVTLAAYRLAETPVTNDEFLAFVKANPQWRRGRVLPLFADEGYLRHWAAPLALGAAAPPQPVVNVSWFAADAYCRAQGARLPTWYEWEWAAAADETRADARADPAWRQRILDWYAQSAASPLDQVGQTPANVHGVRDLHGLVWEWVEDTQSLMVSADNREQGDPDVLKFCGAGALTMEQKENYAVLMRIAMLSSLKAAYTTSSLGFRCARDDTP